ncbi:hypothetical protein K7X08_036374 [Anisodus acutangulus]|uniref:Uncharacterized protein n=1 Tax=Anisodus acutangulus TaxID=402998 RepID=A0A9Q1QVU8_9SOLA|nr:hypothetical protein K7X08_036374 [Anisodus acutangulus]
MVDSASLVILSVFSHDRFSGAPSGTTIDRSYAKPFQVLQVGQPLLKVVNQVIGIEMNVGPVEFRKVCYREENKSRMYTTG